MSSPSSCTDPSMRADYQALFSASQTVTEVVIFHHFQEQALQARQGFG